MIGGSILLAVIEAALCVVARAIFNERRHRSQFALEASMFSKLTMITWTTIFWAKIFWRFEWKILIQKIM